MDDIFYNYRRIHRVKLLFRCQESPPVHKDDALHEEIRPDIEFSLLQVEDYTAGQT